MTKRALLLAPFLVAGCVEPEDDRAQWGYIHAAIVEPSCATIGCHSAATAASPEGEDPLDLSAPDLDTCKDLLDREVFLYITGQGSDEYPLMPPDEPLGAADVRLMSEWIDFELVKAVPCE